jgi:selenide, water dikinase
MAPKHSSQFLSPRCGCLAKLAPLKLETLLSSLAESSGRPSFANAEDAAVILPAMHKELCASVDFGPPVDVTPEIAGRIAVLHALNDVYAVLGTPRWALALLTLGPNHNLEWAESALIAMSQECASAGAELIGGHTTVGSETILGLVAIGAPRSTIRSKKNAQPGDEILITKPIGTGLAMTAARRSRHARALFDAAIECMLTSSSRASEQLASISPNALTDVSGFGLLGHLVEMLPAGCGASIFADQVPLLPGLSDFPPELVFHERIRENEEYVRSKLLVTTKLSTSKCYPLFDPQTSGGLLACLCPSNSSTGCLDNFYRIGRIDDSGTLKLS